MNIEIKPTGKSPFEGDDLGVYVDGVLDKSYNTLSDGSAHTHAKLYALGLSSFTVNDSPAKQATGERNEN